MTQATDLVDTMNSRRIYTIEHGGETVLNVKFADVGAELERLVAKYGAPPAPKVTEVVQGVSVVAAPGMVTGGFQDTALAVVHPASSAAPSASANVARGDGNVDAEGKARSERDLAALRAAGFAPKQTLYARGTRVVDVGVENARQFRLEYEAKPLVHDAVEQLRDTIRAEQRADVMVPRSTVFMNSVGELIVGADASKKKLLVEDEAFRQLCNRLGLPAGAGQYLAECWPELRARNINNWTQVAKESDAVAYADAQRKRETFEPDEVVFRTRKHPASDRRIAFAVVSPEYNEFDADKFAEAIDLAMPADARCSIAYDGRRAKIEVLFHSTVKPEDYVCGEFFRASLIMRTDDTGRGGIRGYGAVEQNLCLNLIITSKNALPIFNIAHRQEPAQLARRIREGLKKAEESIAHFLKVWGYARKDDLVAQAKARGELYEGMSASEVFVALANGAIERDLVPVRGRRDVVLPQLQRAWEGDRSGDGPTAGTVTRAGLINAFTKWAHTDCDEPWFTDKVEVGAARLLWSANDRQTAPITIPAIPLGA